ncbi:HNH endonuclease signature motif containing protein [Microbacterium sp. 1.5R]|uniref:HNH endonuclease signature motif containing protein n=1 Tax=Microbacterium sp. 1.5R TaxID=1916917 RepID=UPI0011A86A68|nr:HNH endonuclease signature motif containing protein [Microbacterium sp. 1.5R]
MTALLDATDSQMAALAGLVETLRVADQTLAAMQAARDGLLAIAGKLALDIAKQGSHPDGGDHTIRAVAAEIGAVQRVSDRTVERRISDATLLVEQFPTVWAAQGAGRLSAAHSRVIVDAGAHLSDDADRAAYAAQMIPLAEEQSPNRLRPLARRVAERFLVRSIDERHRDARASRRVWVTDGEDGMAGLHVHAPAVLVHGMFDRLSQAAHALRDENRALARAATREEHKHVRDERMHLRDERMHGRDERTVDEIRADLLTDLVLTGVPAGHDTTDGMLGAIQARVDITVPALTLIGGEAADAMGAPPAELDGAIPVDAETARVLAGDASGWNRVLTDPVSGRMLAVDRYRPSEHLRRHLRARDQRCRFPGCGIAARKCDLDHNHDAATGGETCATNLAHFCRRHHVLKHHSPWHVEQLGDGVLRWTSPTGQHYTDHPPAPNTVVFRDADAVAAVRDADRFSASGPGFDLPTAEVPSRILTSAPAAPF